MFRQTAIVAAFLSLISLASVVPGVTPATLRAPPATSIATSSSRFARAHSLGDSYQFDPRDGWNSVNVTNLQYKYQSRDSMQVLEKRAGKQKSTSKSSNKTSSKAISSLGSLGKINPSPSFWSKLGFKAKEDQPTDVTITWYTGQDLKNPSCWSSGSWAPTDESFVCAVTLDGWTTKPQCFKFLELCNGPLKCVFVRVVDSCAGCAAGSKHVDLTKSAFSALADVNEGTLDVKMRPATDPSLTDWLENLWGPQH